MTLTAEPTAPLDRLSFVLSSTQREKVLGSLLGGMKHPAQIAKDTNLRLPHVSRALAQLAKAELIFAASHSTRGKLYAVTPLGRTVYEELTEARGDRLVAPLARGSHFRNYHHWAPTHYGKKRAGELLPPLRRDPGEVATPRS